jgi:catechol 2,3-dioxygenase-like lactoylglutathione lyase family enzyme
VTIVQKFGYLAVGVSNLDEATEFYSRFVRLDLTERVGSTAFMTGGIDHHWIRLEEGNHQGLKRVGYEVVSEDSFAQARAGLTEYGIGFEEGGDPGHDRVQHWLRFTDPGGTDIELYYGMYERGVAPVGSGVTLEKFLHGGWETKSFTDTTRFYQDVLGFKASDWIGDKVGFFRAEDKFHHSLVLLNSQRSQFNHFCIQVESIDDVMRFRNNAVRHGVKLRDDLLRHAPSGSIGVYMHDEARGFAVEYCIGHPQVDDATHRPRILPMAPETADIWRSPLPERAVAAAQGDLVRSLSSLPDPGATAPASPRELAGLPANLDPANA